MNEDDSQLYREGILFGLGLAQRAITRTVDQNPTSVETRTLLYALRDHLASHASKFLYRPPVPMENEVTPHD